MAKLKAPLMSLGASGALGKALVFFPWKGIDAVREYVIPSNPKTALQTTQRGYLTACVAQIHAAQALAAHPLDELDTSAYARLGGTRKTPRTWFNEMVKLWIDCKILADKPVVYTDGTVTTATVGAIDIELYQLEETADDLVAGKFYFGSSKTNLIHSVAATVTPHVSVALAAEDCAAFLTAGVKYYFQFRPDVADDAEGANSGIYTFVGA